MQLTPEDFRDLIKQAGTSILLPTCTLTDLATLVRERALEILLHTEQEEIPLLIAKTVASVKEGECVGVPCHQCLAASVAARLLGDSPC